MRSRLLDSSGFGWTILISYLATFHRGIRGVMLSSVLASKYLLLVMQNLKNCMKASVVTQESLQAKGFSICVLSCQRSINQCVCRCVTSMCEKMFLQNQPEKPNLINKHFRTWATGGKNHCREKGNLLSLARKHKGFEGWWCGGIFHEEHWKPDCSSVGRVSY